MQGRKLESERCKEPEPGQMAEARGKQLPRHLTWDTTQEGLPHKPEEELRRQEELAKMEHSWAGLDLPFPPTWNHPGIQEEQQVVQQHKPVLD